MSDLNFLRRLLQNTQKHATVIGNIWLQVLFVFRILVLGAAAQGVWADEYSEFTCNTQQPGCVETCYGAALSLSHIRFWVLQIISVSIPTFIYLAYVLHIILQEDQRVNKEEMKENLCRWSDDERGDISNKIQLAQKEEKLSTHNEHDKTNAARHMMKIYVGSIVFKIMIELAFIVGQVYLYGLQFLPRYQCSETPCLFRVDCYMSRSKEKTVFIIFMLAMACTSLLLNVLEFCSLGLKMCKWRPKSSIFA